MKLLLVLLVALVVVEGQRGGKGRGRKKKGNRAEELLEMLSANPCACVQCPVDSTSCVPRPDNVRVKDPTKPGQEPFQCPEHPCPDALIRNVPGQRFFARLVKNPDFRKNPCPPKNDRRATHCVYTPKFCTDKKGRCEQYECHRPH